MAVKKKSPFFKKRLSLSMIQAIVFVLVFGSVGAYAVYRSFAASPNAQVKKTPQHLLSPLSQ